MKKMETLQKYVGRKIAAASLADDRLALTFDDGARIVIYDDGQSCCEYRYMTTDDDPNSLVGHELRYIESKSGPNKEDAYDGAHEIAFLEIGTDQNFITIANHNEHNGYYGGFDLTIREVSSPTSKRTAT